MYHHTFSLSGSHTPFFFRTKRHGNTPTRTPKGGIECKGYEWFSTNILLYLWNDTPYTVEPRYCGRRIRNRTQAFEWCYLQSPSVTSNLDFKVTPLFHGGYLKNCTKYRHSYNELLIGTYALLKIVIWMIFSDSAKYSMTRSLTQSLCDSWPSFLYKRDCRMLHVTEYFTKSVNVIQGHWKCRRSIDHAWLPVGLPL